MFVALFNLFFISDNLMCTAGATNGLMLLTCCLFKWGDYVFVEDPTYFLAIKIFREDLGLNIIPGNHKLGFNFFYLEVYVTETL